ncbi:Eukaryotic elongation factor 5A hypusine, DNA-binding OB fold [Geosmithia morbida]|uniref:Eukaryotic elongation factor 5A hypusine, DNA-binding OB fold n=1 Tax=Geosmithia morbida TaxID=1094350 RepID=A0A9P4YX60_9HYPO|nr:Eukaryotic elongation factor 5A hypusine, DNA-binding OB fold [Geosmithia morbida]KAF4124716.1 Eukaryotic elongation factor 5A hypusine, DNA-binding OB fold [Geosmithia morbida]
MPKVANLDFEARVPVPFSIFPSTYKSTEAQTQTAQQQLQLPQPQQPGREGQYSSYSGVAADIQQQLPQPQQPQQPAFKQEFHFTATEEERYPRPGIQQEQQPQHFHQPSLASPQSYVQPQHDVARPPFAAAAEYEPRRPSVPQSEYSSYSQTNIEVNTPAAQYLSPIDRAERQYRERLRPQYIKDTVDAPSRSQFSFSKPTPEGYAVDKNVSRASFRDRTVFEERSEPAVTSRAQQKSNMGYYDEDGHYHSFRHGVHKLADRIAHPLGHEHHHHHREDVGAADFKAPPPQAPAPAPMASPPRPRPGDSGEAYLPNTVTIPCHHIRLGDFLMLQGRPCQVIRISTSAATGQYRYLGVDIFTKQLHEESSFVSNPAPSVVVQTMLGPVFKQYRVLDVQGTYVVAMTESGDVKQDLPVIDQSNLHTRLARAFDAGRGSVRVLVLNDNGQELAVDMKVVHGSHL